MNIFKRILEGFKKTNESISARLSALFQKGDLDDEFFDELEFTLISSDMGIKTTQNIIETVRAACRKQKIKNQDEFRTLLKQTIVDILKTGNRFETNYPVAMLVVGVNGVGKTTTIGKLGHFYKKTGKNVVFAAADTFRAAASEQLTTWAERSKARIIKQGEGADAASVVFDAIASAKSKNDDVLLIDTAGRLHNKINLMDEIRKINRVVEKEWGANSFKKLIVLDATTGQNALSQVEYFNDAIGIDGIILTKLDGTAKGGMIIPIVSELKIPVAFIGVGEKVDDLIEFNPDDFVNAIL